MTKDVRQLPFRVLVDTREQTPYEFENIPAPRKGPGGDRPFLWVPQTRATLPYGDYGAEIIASGERVPIAIERKSKADLYQTVTRGRERFGREFERAVASGDYFALVVEDTLGGLREPPPFSEANWRSVVRTLFSWSVRYRVPVWLAGSRRLGELATIRLLSVAAEAHRKKVRKKSDQGPCNLPPGG